MGRLFPRVKAFFKLGYWAFQNPHTLNESIFKLLGKLFEFIMKVANEKKPYMTHIAFIHPEGEKNIVSLWAGAGVGADPLKRIRELIEENEILKAQVKQLSD